MARKASDDKQPASEEQVVNVSRRSLLTKLGAAGAAGAAGLVALGTPKIAEATSGTGPDGNLVMGSNFLNTTNTASQLTLQTVTSTFSSSGSFFGFDPIIGGSAQANITGLYATGKGSGSGVVGANNISAPVSAVGANAEKSGVLGTTNQTGGAGVKGLIHSSANVPDTTAVWAENQSPNTGSVAGGGGVGCYGFSEKGHGIVGATGVASGSGVVGAIKYVETAPMSGTFVPVAGALAGIFYGETAVVEAPHVIAVLQPGVGYRELPSMASPEAWFEDVGQGTLTEGEATVTLDPVFASFVDASTYHVFITEYDGNHSLYVTAKTATGFSVKAAKQRKKANGPFSWRVIAKRSDITTERLKTVQLPPSPTAP